MKYAWHEPPPERGGGHNTATKPEEALEDDLRRQIMHETASALHPLGVHGKPVSTVTQPPSLMLISPSVPGTTH